jgi:hypothetical protein
VEARTVAGVDGALSAFGGDVLKPANDARASIAPSAHTRARDRKSQNLDPINSWAQHTFFNPFGLVLLFPKACCHSKSI